jgi:hypothetical protein
MLEVRTIKASRSWETTVKLRIVLILMVSGFCCAVLPASKAAADACEPSGNHCFSTVVWTPDSGSSFSGARATSLHVNCMAPLVDADTDTISETLWVGGGPRGSDDFADWVEAGELKGGPTAESSHLLYWAEADTAGDPLAVHFLTSGYQWTYGTAYNVFIYQVAQDGYWTVDISWPSSGEWEQEVATKQSTQSYIVQAGLESGNSGDVAEAAAGGLEYGGTEGTFYDGWSNSTRHAQLGPDDYSGNTNGYWNTEYTSFHSEQNDGDTCD